MPISDGKLAGEELQFALSVEMNGQAIQLKGTGTVKGDELAVKLAGGERTFEFTTKRAGSQ